MAERRLWTEFEDNALRYLRQECQIQKWSEIAIKMIEIFNITDRNEKQCRDRYTNSLNPNLNLNDWNEEDELLLIDCHKKYGNKWTIIAEKFKGRYLCANGRTDSFIKNHFYSRLRKCIRKLNRFIDEQFKKKYKKLNLNIIFKLTNLVQDKLTKISQDVREFYERMFFVYFQGLMYDLVNFSLKAEQGIREYDANQIETFVLALTSLENLSGAIGANRKPKRGRGHKKEEKYLISTDGLCLVLLEDQLILRKEVDLQFEASGMISEGESDEGDQAERGEMGSSEESQYGSNPRSKEGTSQLMVKLKEAKKSLSQNVQTPFRDRLFGSFKLQTSDKLFQSGKLFQGGKMFQSERGDTLNVGGQSGSGKGSSITNENSKPHVEHMTKLEIEDKEPMKVKTIESPQMLPQKEQTMLNEHEHSSYSDIMDYIMQNSFDCNDNILSLSKQGSLEFDNLF